MSTPTQFRHYLISQDAAGANIELVRSGEQVCVLAFDAKRLCFVQCHVLLEPLRNKGAFEERGRRIATIGHPLAARLLECGEDDGSPYYITENVDGETLRTLVSRYENFPVWLAQRLSVQALAALTVVVAHGDFVPTQPLDALRVLQTSARELRVHMADYRVVDSSEKPARGAGAKAAFDKQAQFISTYLTEQAENGRPGETAMLNASDFLELLHNLFLACTPEVGKEMEALRRRLEETSLPGSLADIATPYKPKALLAPLLATYQEVARGVVQSVRVQSQRLDPSQPYALRGTLMKTGQNVFVEQVAPPLLAGMIPGEVLRQAKSQPRGGKYPNLVPVISVEEREGIECVVESAVEGVNLVELLANRGRLDEQETYLVLAGVDSALAQLEKAERPVMKLRLEDIFLFTGFGQGRAKDAELLRTRLNEWPGFSIVLRAHPSMHSMSGRGTDPAMLLPPETKAQAPAEPLWNGGWMAALSTFLLGSPLAKGTAGLVEGLLEEELTSARNGTPSARASFLAKFARVLREGETASAAAQWQEVSATPLPAKRLSEKARQSPAPAAEAVPPESRPKTALPQPRKQAAPPAALTPPPLEVEETHIGFAEALIRGTAAGHREEDLPGLIAPGRTLGHDGVESSWSGFRQEKPLWLKVALWSLVAIALGGLLAHMQGRAFWQSHPVASVSRQKPDGLPDSPPATAPNTPLLPPPSPADLPKPQAEPKSKPATPDTLTTRLRQIRLSGGKLPDDLKPAAEKAAHAGNTEAMLAMGNAILSGATGSDEEKAAFTWYQKAHQAGDPNARFPLAQCYLQGWGTPADHPRAVALLIAASKSGEGPAKDLLGVCYARGLGVPRDDTKAFEFCNEAHEAGVPSACGNLGTMYLNGQGVARDPDKAVKLFVEGSKKGNAESMLQYAHCLENGTGTPVDAAEASLWYQQAAKGGNAEAISWCHEHKVVY